MAHKVTIGLQSVQEIMFLPVRGMAEYSHLYPELFDDIGRISSKIIRGDKNE